MYEAFFGFAEKPFSLTPDPKYLYLSARHTEAFAHLQFGHQERGGFVVITGEVGTGKTTLARSFLGRLGPETKTAVVLYPALTAAELLRTILDDLHVTPAGESLKDLVDALHRFLLEARGSGRNVVLLIDEAQDLAPDVLEQIRLLSNLETDTEKLIQIVLMGQSELLTLLGRRELRQLAQRVTARYHLAPLDRAETAGYIRHRLEVAHGGGKVNFTEGALGAVFSASSGVPRLINLICDRSLLAGYARGLRDIDAAIVRQAAREVAGQRAARVSWQGLTALFAGIALAAAAATPLWREAPAATAPTPAAPASPATAPPAKPAEPPASGRLAGLVRTAPRDESRARALQQVEQLWSQGPLQQSTLRANLDRLRELDLPAVLEMFHPSRAETCSLALLSLEGDKARVAILGETFEVAWRELDPLWTRQAVVPWRDFEGVGTDPAVAQPWLRERLARLGYLREGDDVGASLSRFQKDAGLVVDGIFGAQTLLSLYGRGAEKRPHLRGGAS